MEKEDWTKLQSTTLTESLSTQVEQVVEQAKDLLNLKDKDAAPPKTAFSALTFLKSLKGQHTRPVEALSYYAVMEEDNNNEPVNPTGTFAVWSADSMGRICIWELSRDSSGLQAVFKYTWLAHETAINEIRMSEEECWTGASSINLAVLTVEAYMPISPQCHRIIWQLCGASICRNLKSHLYLQ